MKSKAGSKKRMNSYLKIALIMLISGIVGGIFGFCTSYFGETGVKSAGDALFALLHAVQLYMLPLLCIVLAVEVLIGEAVYLRLKKLAVQIPRAEDEEGDLLEYELEKISALGMIAGNTSLGLSMLILGTGYTTSYIMERVQTSLGVLSGQVLVFLLITVYVSVWQIKYIKMVQKIYPEKKGDPASMNFQKQWINSCDEAEKEVIYQSSYETFQIAVKCMPFFVLVAMLCHMVWNTGVFAIVLTSVMWIFLTTVYQILSLRKMKAKLNG